MSENFKDGDKPSKKLTNLEDQASAIHSEQNERSFKQQLEQSEGNSAFVEEQKRRLEAFEKENAEKKQFEARKHCYNASSYEDQKMEEVSTVENREPNYLYNKSAFGPLNIASQIYSEANQTLLQEQAKKEDASKPHIPSAANWKDFEFKPDAEDKSISNKVTKPSQQKEQVSQNVRKIEFQNAQTESDLVEITFLCYHYCISKFKDNCEFWLEIENISIAPIQGKLIEMRKIEEDVIMAKAFFNKNELQNSDFLQYRYHLKDYWEYKCYSITRYKRYFGNLNTYFDTPNEFHTSNYLKSYDKKEDQPLKRYIKLILEKYIQNNYPGDPQMLEKLALFFKACAYEFYFAELFEGLNKQLKNHLENGLLKELSALLQFTLSSLHYVFNAQRESFVLYGKENERTFKDLLDFLATDFIQEELVKAYERIFEKPMEQAQAFEKGLKRLIELRPDVGILFLDFSDLFSDFDGFLEKYSNVKNQGKGFASLEQSISILNKVNVNFNSAATKKLKDKIKQSMMNQCKNFIELLKIEAEVEKEFELQDILAIVKKLKSTFYENELQNFIKDNFDTLCHHKRLKSIMIEDIKRTAMQSLGLQNQMNFLIKVAKNCPELYTPAFFIHSSQDATLIIRENILTLLTLLAEQQKRSIFFSFSELEQLIKNLSESIFQAYQRIIDAFEQSLILRFFCTKLDLQFLVTQKIDPQFLLKLIDEYALKYLTSIKDQQIFGSIREFQQCQSLKVYPPTHPSIQQHLGFIKIFFKRIIDLMVNSIDSGKLKEAEVFLLQIYDQKSKWRLFSLYSQELSNELFAAITAIESELNENGFWEESIFLTIAQIDYANGWEIEGLSELRDKVIKLVEKINNIELTFNEALIVLHNYEKPLMKKILQQWFPEQFDEKNLLKMKPLCKSISELTGMYEGFQDWIEQFKQIHGNEVDISVSKYREELENLNYKKGHTPLKEYSQQGPDIYFIYFNRFKTIKNLQKLEQSTVFQTIFREHSLTSQLAKTYKVSKIKYMAIKKINEEEEMRFIGLIDENNEEEEEEEEEKSSLFEPLQMNNRMKSFRESNLKSLNDSQKLFNKDQQRINQSLGSFKLQEFQLKRANDDLEEIKLEDLDKEFEEMIRSPLHIQDLQNYYKESSLTVQSIKQFWSFINTSTIQESIQLELQKLSSVYNINNDSKTKLIRDFKNFFDRVTLQKDVQILLKMKFLLEGKHELNLYNQLENQLKEFLNVIQNIEDNTQLAMISEQIQEIKILVDDINAMNNKANRDKIQGISILEQVGRSQELYEFALMQQDVNFNDLYERLDDTSFLSTTTITDMNSVVAFFMILENQIAQNAKKEALSLKTLAIIISECLNNELSKDHSFNVKLKNCIESLHALKVLTTASLNLSENTQRIVRFIMSGTGRIQILREENYQECDYRVSYMDEAFHENHINHEDLMRHQNRLQLILRSQQQSDLANSDKEELKKDHENFAKQVLVFSQMLQNIQEIAIILQKLHLSGHLKYNDNQASYIDKQINQDTIIEILISEKAEFEDELDQWKEALLEEKFTHYYLTYVPNMKLKPLIEFLERPSNESLKSIKSVFTFIDPSFDQASLLRTIKPIAIARQKDITHQQVLNQLGEALNGIFNPLNNKTLSKKIKGESLFESKNKMNESKMKLLIEGDRIFRLLKEIDIIKAIVSIFSFAEIRPRSWNILFCTQTTMLSQIENFVLRSHTPEDDKIPFIIANFDQLPLVIQYSAYNFIVEQDLMNKERLLLILFLQAQFDNGTHLIEELHGRTIFNMMLEDIYIRMLLQDSCKAQTVISKSCGVGKSFWIKQAIDSQQNRDYVRILISGQMTTDKFIKFHDMKSLSRNDQPIGIHYDIYPTSDINASLFQAMVLQTIISGEEFIYHMPYNCQFYLEISHNISQSINDYIFGYFKCHEITWNLNNLKIDLTPQSRMQILCKFLQALETKQAINIKSIQDEQIICSQDECIRLLNQHYISKQKRPNFYLLNSFILFASDQLQRLLSSPYFMDQELIDDQFGEEGPTFYRQIVDTIIILSRELAQVEASQTQQDNAMNNIPLEEQQVSRLEGLRWENTAALFIMINDSGTITPIFKDPNDLPECISLYFKTFSQYATDIQPFERMNPDQVIEKVSRIFSESWEQLQMKFILKGIDFDFQRISFTRDNFLKLALIYLRIRVGLPAIVMGETGVGKTAIINYLADALQYEFRVLNVHAGITEEDIEIFINEAQDIAIKNEEKGEGENKVILFFDEINTNILIEGLLKEIVIDKHYHGNPLHPNLCMVAACNPYQLRAIKQSEQNWDEADRKDQGISAGIQHISFKKKLSNLVYTVKPLPESVFSFIWDYGSLSSDEEQKIIMKIISTINQSLSKIPEANSISTADLKLISQCVCHSQNFTRKKEAKWAVSLRDVARFAKLFCYFVQNNARAYGEREKGSDLLNDILCFVKIKSRKINYSNLQRAFVLSLCFCYMFRIAKKSDRTQYINEVEEFTKRTSFSINSEDFINILEQEYSRLLINMEIPKGIGKNTPLKENIFVIFTCIMNKIPLIITGKPGSTKTLAMNLVIKSMRGTSSHQKFFQLLPAVLQYSYQGSLQSTSDGIKRIFEKAITCQQNIKGQNVIVLVIIDEIGLAEISPHNPLKVLHSLLEFPKVAVVGISNWALDASKMNRAITLSRPDPDKNDLIESARSINEQINSQNERKMYVFNEQYLEGLVEGYYEYYKNQLQYNFHGLRDFYSITQYICSHIEAQSYNISDIHAKYNELIIIKGIERNFGGQNIKVIIEYFREAMNWDHLKKINYTPTKQLLLENIEDKNSRHLMVITPDNEEDVIASLENILKELQQDYRVFQGSDFPDDTSEESAYRLINEITLCMERGITCVLQNLSIIYQSFYDMLNQNYQVVNDQRFCKVAIGSDSTRCLVHSEFKCIVVATESEVKGLDPPLLNRFEKQIFAQNQLLESKNDMDILSFISKWTEDISSVENFERKDIFPVQIGYSSLMQLVIQSKQLQNQVHNDSSFLSQTIYEDSKDSEGSFQEMINTSSRQSYQQISSLATMPSKSSFNGNSSLSMKDQINYCKNKILRLATLAGVKRAKMFKENLLDDSFQDLSEILTIENFLKASPDASCSIIYTFQTAGLKTLADSLMAQNIELDAIRSRAQFEAKVQEYFSSQYRSEFFIIHATSLLNSNHRINICKSIIDSFKAAYEKLNPKSKKNVLFIIKLADPSIDQRHAKFKNGWDECLIEVINGRGRTQIEITQLLTYDLTHLYNNEIVFNYLVQCNIAEIMSKIKYDGGEEVILERIDAVKNALNNKSAIYNSILTCFNQLQQVLSQNDQLSTVWQEQMVMNKALMRSKNNFHGAAMEFISRIFVKNLTFLVFKLESDGLINAIQNQKSAYFKKPQIVQAIFKHLFKEDYINGFNMATKPVSYNFDIPYCHKLFPFIRHIHSAFNSLQKPTSDKISKIQNALVIALKDKFDQRSEEAFDEFDESMDLAHVQLREQVEIIIPACLKVLDINSESSYKMYLTDLSSIIANNSISRLCRNKKEKEERKSEQKSLAQTATMKIMCLLIQNFENIGVADLYAVYWNHYQCIQDVITVLENCCSYALKPKEILEDINLDDTLSKHISASYLQIACCQAICIKLLPTQGLLQKLKTQRIGIQDKSSLENWDSLASKALNFLKTLSTFKQVSCKEYRTLDFMILISKELVKPFNLRSDFLHTMLSRLDQKDPSEDPDSVIETIMSEIQEIQTQNEDQNYSEIEIAMARFLYEYLEDRLSEIENQDFNRLDKLLKIIFNMLRFDYKLHDIFGDQSVMQPRECLSDERYTFLVQCLIQKVVDAIIRITPETFNLHLEQGNFDKQAQSLIKMFNELLFISDQSLKIDIEHQIPVIFMDMIERAIIMKYRNDDNRADTILDRPETRYLLQTSIEILLRKRSEAIEIEEEKKDNHNINQLEEQKLQLIHTEAMQDQILENQQDQNSLLQQIIAVANFRAISKSLVKSFAESIQNKAENIQLFEESLSNNVKMAFTDLTVIFNENILNERAEPLMIYFVKLLKQEIDINKFREQIRVVTPWLLSLNLYTQENYQSFNLQIPSKINQQFFEVITNEGLLRAQLKEYMSNEIEPKDQLMAKLATIQHFYFNGQINTDQNCRRVAYEVIRQKCLGELDRDFLGFYIQGNANQYMTQRAIETVQNKGEIHGELFAYLGTLVFQSDPNSFIHRLIFQPESLKEIYVPFQVNTRDDFKYQSLFKAGDSFARYRCKNCREIFCVVDCGALAGYRGAGASSKCDGCQQLIGFANPQNSERIDQALCTLQNFKTDNEAVQSYIRLEPEEDDQLTTRNLHPAVRRLGTILLHALMAISQIFGSRTVQQQIVGLVRPHFDANRGIQEADIEAALTHLIKTIDYMWQQTRQSFQLSNTQLLQLMEYIGLQMFIRSSQPMFSLEQFKSKEGRIEFEQVFQDKVIPDLQQSLQDNFSDFFKGLTATKIRNPLIEKIDEVVEISQANDEDREKNKFSALRIQSQITFNSFRQFVSARQDINNIDNKFVDFVLKYQNLFEFIHLLQPLLSFGIFVLKYFNGKVNRSNALDNSLIKVIDAAKFNNDLRQLSVHKAQEFCNTWSILANQLQEIREVCDSIKLNQLSLDSPFQYCCLTNMSKDSLGFHFFLALRYLAQKQNEFLRNMQKALPELYKEDEIHTVRLLDLADGQILMHGNENFQQFITNLIDKNSFSDIRYGHGRQINYNVEKIAKKLKQMVLHNKVLIDYDYDIKFIFQGNEEENNLYEWYEFLSTRIPQEQNPDCQSLVNMLGANKNEDTNDSKSKLLQDLTITMSFLCQTGGPPDKSLEAYMKAFNILQSLTDIKNYPSLRLKHVLDLYEKVENSLEIILIERTQPRYRLELTEQEQLILRGILKNLPELNKDEQIQTLRRSLGLLCIRQLSNNQNISETPALFPYLFNEMNVYLFGIYNEQNLNAKLEEMKVFQNHFQPSTITLGQSFQAYQMLHEIDDQIQREKREIEEQQLRDQRANQKRIQEQEEIRRREAAGGGNILAAKQPEIDVFQFAEKQQQKGNQYPGGGIMMKNEGAQTGANMERPQESKSKRPLLYGSRKK